MRHQLSLSILAFGLFSCASNQGAPPAAPEPAPAPSASAPAPSESAAPAPSEAATPTAINWDSMDKEARGKYMQKVVMPKMKEVFVAFNAKYADMKCTTCHGAGVKTGTFAMPNPDLPKLPADMSKFKEWAAKKPEMTEFMVKHVKPEMAKLLNIPEYTEQTKSGFGCGACHTMAAK